MRSLQLVVNKSDFKIPVKNFNTNFSPVNNFLFCWVTISQSRWFNYAHLTEVIDKDNGVNLKYLRAQASGIKNNNKRT